MRKLPPSNLQNNLKQTTGKAGEDAACTYLRTCGYTILIRNYRGMYGEIDIIAQRDNILSFIEVKTRADTRYGMPYEAVTAWKARHMKYAAEEYILKTRKNNFPCKFAVISLFLKNGIPDGLKMYDMDPV